MREISEGEWAKIRPTLRYLRGMQEKGAEGLPHCFLRCSGTSGGASRIVQCDTRTEADEHLRKGSVVLLWKKSEPWPHPRGPVPKGREDEKVVGGLFSSRQEGESRRTPTRSSRKR